MVSMENLNSILRDGGKFPIPGKMDLAAQQAGADPKWKTVLLEYLLNMKRKGFEVKELGKVATKNERVLPISHLFDLGVYVEFSLSLFYLLEIAPSRGRGRREH